MISKRALIGGAFLVAGTLAVVALIRVSPGGATGVEVGDRLPEYSAPDLSGEPVSFSAQRGKVTLISVWATWCGPCRVEMPSIQDLYDRYGERGFTVLAVSIDQGPGHRDKVKEFVERYELTFPILLDPEGEITRRLRTVGVPENFVVDKQGRLVKRVIGASDWSSEANRALIEELLAL